MQAEGKAADGFEVGGNIVAALAVAARERLHKLSIFVAHGDGDAVDLRFENEGAFVFGCVGLDLFFFEEVVERHHGDGVRGIFEAFERLAADALGGGVGVGEFRKLFFELGQAAQHEVEFAVIDFRGGVDVVEPVVVFNFGAQFFYFILGVEG